MLFDTFTFNSLQGGRLLPVPPCAVLAVCVLQATDDNMSPRDPSPLSAESYRKCSGYRPANGVFQREQTQTVAKGDRK